MKSYPERPQYKDVYMRTKEMLQRSDIFKVNRCLKVHSAHLKLAYTLSKVQKILQNATTLKSMKKIFSVEFLVLGA